MKFAVNIFSQPKYTKYTALYKRSHYIEGRVKWKFWGNFLALYSRSCCNIGRIVFQTIRYSNKELNDVVFKIFSYLYSLTSNKFLFTFTDANAYEVIQGPKKLLHLRICLVFMSVSYYAKWYFKLQLLKYDFYTTTHTYNRYEYAYM